jgi:hypothetical protein
VAIYILLWLILCLTPHHTFAQAQQYDKQAPSAKGLIAWWRGTPGFTYGPKLYDLLGLSHGTLTNMGTGGLLSGWAAGTRSTSKGEVRFDGSNDSVNMAFPFVMDMAQQYTWSFWINPKNTTTEYQALWGQVTTPGTTPAFNIWMHSTNDASYGPVTSGFTVQIASSSTATLVVHSTSNAIVTNAWQHFVVTFDGALTNANKVKIYVNGVNKTDSGDIVVGAGGLPVTSTYTQANIGIDTYGDPTLNGAIDDVRVYNRALTPSDILYTMQQGLTGEPAMLGPPPPVSPMAVARATPQSQFFKFFPNR